MSNPAGEGDLLRSGWQARSRQEKVGARDKMQPSLLDRLTDNDPEKKRESANSNLITHAALRRNVLRDLQWLFNTINHDASSDLSGLTQVSRSVVNFGVAPLAGKECPILNGTTFSASSPKRLLTLNRGSCRRGFRFAACPIPPR